jgi:phosphoribosylformimino-5-aminoimidazole carboxamide ribotide isomerase
MLFALTSVKTESELPKLLEIGCEGVIIGKAIYEKKISLQTLSEFNTLNS